MPDGLSGHLLSASFLERRLGISSVDTRARRQFAAARQAAGALGPASSLRSLLDAGAGPVVAVFGFGPPQDVERLDAVLASTFVAEHERVALIITPWAEPLDLVSSIALRQAMLRSARWCALFNGTHLRLVDAALPYSRRFVQFDLDTVADDEGAFAAFSYVMGCLPGSLRSLVDASEQHGIAVCRSLKDGVLSASADVLRALVRPSSSSTASPAASFEQALTIVYRILFLLFAEARGLVPVWHPVYRDSYSIAVLGAFAERTGHAHGLWAALRAIARLAHAGCRAGDLRVTPFNGRLFAPAGTPLAERRDLDDEAARTSTAGAHDASCRRRRRARAHRVRRPRRRTARHGVRDAARLRTDTAPQARGQATGCAVRRLARPRLRRAQGDRHVLYAAADRRLRRATHARPARARRAARADPRPAHRRSGDGQRRLSGRGVPVPRPGVRSVARPVRGMPRERHRRARAGRHPPDDRRTVSLRRRSQPDGRAAGAAVALARHALGRSAADVSRSSSSGGRQPARRVAVDARQAARAPPRVVPARLRHPSAV